MKPEVMKTVYPDKPLSEEEWMKEFKVSTRVAKHTEGLIKAGEIMRQWQNGCHTFIFQYIGDRIAVK